MRMTEAKFEQEFQYQTITYFIKKLLKEGLISEDEFLAIDVENRKKYQPITGALLSGKFLICVPNRANICTEREAQSDAKHTET